VLSKMKGPMQLTAVNAIYLVPLIWFGSGLIAKFLIGIFNLDSSGTGWLPKKSVSKDKKWWEGWEIVFMGCLGLVFIIFASLLGGRRKRDSSVAVRLSAKELRERESVKRRQAIQKQEH